MTSKSDRLYGKSDEPKATTGAPSQIRKQGAAALYDPAKANAALKGIPTSRIQANMPIVSRETYKLPDGVTVDATKLDRFNSLLLDFHQRLSVNTKSISQLLPALGQRLIDFHLAEMASAYDRFNKDRAGQWERIRQAWRSDFRKDPEIGGSREDKTLTAVTEMLTAYEKDVGKEKSHAFMSAIEQTGLGDSPELIRFIAWARGRMAERGGA